MHKGEFNPDSAASLEAVYRRDGRRIFATLLRLLGSFERAEEAEHDAFMAAAERVRNGSAALTDGPFAETKELLAGFYLVDAKDLNDALAIAARILPARYGSIEVRPVRELDVASYGSLTPAAAPAASGP